jgi:hypothetical protein
VRASTTLHLLPHRRIDVLHLGPSPVGYSPLLLVLRNNISLPPSMSFFAACAASSSAWFELVTRCPISRSTWRPSSAVVMVPTSRSLAVRGTSLTAPSSPFRRGGPLGMSTNSKRTPTGTLHLPSRTRKQVRFGQAQPQCLAVNEGGGHSRHALASLVWTLMVAHPAQQHGKAWVV